MSFFYRLCWCIIAPFVRIFMPTKVIGKENTPKGRAIFACNHTSNLDIIVIDCCRVKRPYVLAKHTLFKNKLFGAILKSFGAIPVNRQDLSTTTVRKTLQVLQNDEHLIIFPEGTRKETLDETVALKNGMALFALKTNSPIVPMFMAKKPRIFRCNKLFIGEPLDLKEYEGQRPTKEILSQVSNVVLGKMQKMKSDYESTLTTKQLEKLKLQQKKTIAKDKKRKEKKLLKETNAKK